MKQVPTVHQMHVLICTNKREDNMRDYCRKTITDDDVKEIKQWLKLKKLFPKIKCTRTGCLGLCNKGGTVAIYPQNKFINEIENKEEIKNIIEDEYEKMCKGSAI